MEPFDIRGPLPASGTVLLEASAGTGKTFTVGALVTRYVAEGVATLDEMLVVTFGRAASQELRERVRAQLVDAERVLASPEGADPRRELHDLLLAGGQSERMLRRRRLREALAGFDAATIATTHQFCQQVLRSLGVAGDSDPGATLVENLDELVEQVVDDVYLQWFGQRPDRPPFDRRVALEVAALAVGDPHARLVGQDPMSPAGARAAFADAVRGEIERRKRRLGVLSYDDLLSRLATLLEHPTAPARQRMQRRWRIVIVDEFQDTDPVQWQVLERAFDGVATLVLIGDPKQAIYAFRGGDVAAYLVASRSATTQATLATNRRSDADLVERLQVVLRGAALGDERIAVREVTAARGGTRLSGAPNPAPFRVRAVRRAGFRLARGLIPVRDARAHVAADCAADIARLLRSGATFGGRRLEARDVAVLVRVRDHGLLVARELERHRIPAVTAGGGHVLREAAADEWLALLEAIEQPHRTGRVRAAALTSFFGETTGRLVAGGDDLTDTLADALRGWALLARSRGIAAVFEAAEERGLSARVLGRHGGERLVTDLRHVAELLHQVALREGFGPTALLSWLREERRREVTGAERTRRLDSDAAAVQIVTIHASKGLQYPVVYLPFAYDNFVHQVRAAQFHDDEDRRVLDVTGAGPQWRDHETRHRHEERGEDLRVLYVAMTRAQSQVITWWAPTANTETSGLHRLLLGRRPGDGGVPDRAAVRDDDYTGRCLDAISELGGPAHEQSVIADPAPELPEAHPEQLSVRRFDRDVDADWRRTSYSALIRVEEDAPGVGSEPEVPGIVDEPPTPAVELVETPLVELVETPLVEPVETPAIRPSAALAVPVSLPMATLPAGPSFGSLVHGVLEHADPQAPDLEGELRARVEEQLRRWPVDVSAETLAAALVPVHDTPLGPLAPGVTLRGISRADRLCELDFEIPLAGGDLRRRTHDVLVRDLAAAVGDLLPDDDPLAAYRSRLAAAPLGDQVLRGYLSGSLDVVLRLRSDGGDRFLVVDYKTNLLGDPEREATAADYDRASLAEAMAHSHYPLQAMLYCVVLHRYLRWRLPGYDPERHLGGVLYLFVRGMCGPGTPVEGGHPAGVFSWRPPPALVVRLSDLLADDGGSR